MGIGNNRLGVDSYPKLYHLAQPATVMLWSKTVAPVTANKTTRLECGGHLRTRPLTNAATVVVSLSKRSFGRAVSEERRAMIDRLLLEKIPLAAIARAMQVSQQWLQSYQQR